MTDTSVEAMVDELIETAQVAGVQSRIGDTWARKRSAEELETCRKSLIAALSQQENG